MKRITAILALSLLFTVISAAAAESGTGTDEPAVDKDAVQSMKKTPAGSPPGEQYISTKTATFPEKGAGKQAAPAGKSKFGIGINYTGVHMRYKDCEIKYQTAEEVNLLGFKYYANRTFYPGAELDLLMRDPVFGIEAGILYGFQKRFNNLLFFVDIGYYDIFVTNLRESGSRTYDENGFIINSGITYYLY